MSARRSRARGRVRFLLAWICVGLIAALVLIPHLIGLCLPAEYEGEVVSTIERPPEVVWEALIDPQRNPCTGDRMKSVEMRSGEGELPVWVEDMGSSRVLVRAVEAAPPSKLVLELEDQSTPMSARWQIEVEAVPRGSRVRVWGMTRLPNDSWHIPWFRCMFILSGGQENVLQGYLLRLAG